MKYELSVSLDERDYYNFNKFHMRRSPYGKRTQKTIYILATVMALFIAAMYFLVEGVSVETVLMLFPYAIIIAVMLTLTGPLSLLVLKLQIVMMKHRGKLPYEEKATIQMYDDYFVEITENSKNEIKYTGAEGIMIGKDGSVYVYMNNIMAYILPPSCFESDEQRQEVTSFLLEKIESLN